MINLPKNIFVISLVSGLSYSATTLLMLTGTLAAHELASNNYQSTIPIAVLFACMALSSEPITRLCKIIGQKYAYLLSIAIAIAGSLLAFIAIDHKDFVLFIIATACLGFNAAFVRYSRFIIMENCKIKKQKSQGIFVLAMCCLIGAFLGPYIGSHSDLSFPLISNEKSAFSGSFILLSGILSIAFIVLGLGYNRKKQYFTKQQYIESLAAEPEAKKSSILTIVTQPKFILYVGSQTISEFILGLIIFVIPIKMLLIDGLHLEDITLIIQSHLVAIFLPSLITVGLIAAGLRFTLILLGIAMYLCASLYTLENSYIIGYWWTVVLLGIGWNLIYAPTNALLSNSYKPKDKYITQSLNEFIVNSGRAGSAILAGWLLFNTGWQGLLIIAFTISFLWLVCVLILKLWIHSIDTARQNND